MKKNAFVIDFPAQTLTLSAEFAEAANNPGSKRPQWWFMPSKAIFSMRGQNDPRGHLC